MKNEQDNQGVLRVDHPYRESLPRREKRAKARKEKRDRIRELRKKRLGQ